MRMRSVLPAALALLLPLLWDSPALAQLEPQPGERELDQPQLAPQLVEPPQVLEQVQPEFPAEEQEAGRGGQVVLRLTIDTEGGIDRVEVIESAGPYFDWSAMGAGTQLLFSPARFVMQPVEGDPWPVCDAVEPVQPCATAFAASVQVDYGMTFELSAPPEPPPEKPKPLTGRITGLIREAGSKRALEGVEVVIDVQGEVDEAFSEEDLAGLSYLTGPDGTFLIENVPTGEHTLRLALSGYEPVEETEEFAGDQELQAIYYLVKRSYSKFTTVVRTKCPPKEVTKVALAREEVTKVPGTFGDPLRVIENLPGLARARNTRSHRAQVAVFFFNFSHPVTRSSALVESWLAR